MVLWVFETSCVMSACTRGIWLLAVVCAGRLCATCYLSIVNCQLLGGKINDERGREGGGRRGCASNATKGCVGLECAWRKFGGRLPCVWMEDVCV